MYSFIIKPLLFALPPETAHHAALLALKMGMYPGFDREMPRLRQRLFDLSFPSPVGMAAGFDKNAEALDGLLGMGFGFVEVGTCTPKPQSGNPKPRLFRLREDEAIINRLGFNNLGKEVFVRNLIQHHNKGIVGANIGKNKDTEVAADDYVEMLHAVLPYADYVTINISSPNTAGLRDLQERSSLEDLLGKLADIRDSYCEETSKHLPLMLKIAPDLDDKALIAIAEVVQENCVDGIIVSNTTVARPATLKSANATEQGGLSGRPLFDLSTEILRHMYIHTGGRVPLIGVGGISSAEDAYAKIRAGASLVQLYSALIYHGPVLVERILMGLDAMLERDGFENVSDAVGTAIR